MCQPVTVATDVPQLFVDDAMVASVGGLVRTLHPGRKLPHPVLVPDRPWEGKRVYIYGSVHHDPDGGQFRMWYLSRIGRGHEHRSPEMQERQGDLILYATSEDGVHWEKPNLGRHPFDGSTDNNIIVFDKHSPTVIVDPAAPTHERYRMMAWEWRQARRGYWVAHSADGIDWQEYPVNPVLTVDDEILETVTVARQPQSGEYFAFHRRWDRDRFHRRLIAVATSRDFQHWSAPRTILAPDERDDEWVQDGAQRSEFYGMAGFCYGGQFLGFLPVFDVMIHSTHERDKEPELRTEQSPWEGPIAAQLVHSRDGLNWHRFADRSPIIPRGARGSFDAGCILCSADRPVVHGDEVWHYYTGINTMHGGSLPPKQCVIGRVSWRLDGFVSLDAGAFEGWARTVPLEPAGRRLEVNADAAAGSLAVAVLAEDGTPLDGFGAADCMPLRADRVRHGMRWSGGDRLPGGRPVRLQFNLRDADLYSFRLRA
jgi:hypothetical protein